MTHFLPNLSVLLFQLPAQILENRFLSFQLRGQLISFRFNSMPSSMLAHPFLIAKEYLNNPA